MLAYAAAAVGQGPAAAALAARQGTRLACRVPAKRRTNPRRRAWPLMEQPGTREHREGGRRLECPLRPREQSEPLHAGRFPESGGCAAAGRQRVRQAASHSHARATGRADGVAAAIRHRAMSPNSHSLWPRRVASPGPRRLGGRDRRGCRQTQNRARHARGPWLRPARFVRSVGCGWRLS